MNSQTNENKSIIIYLRTEIVRASDCYSIFLVGLCYLSNVGEEKVLNQQIHYIFLTLNIFVERKTHYIIPQTEQAT